MSGHSDRSSDFKYSDVNDSDSDGYYSIDYGYYEYDTDDYASIEYDSK